MGIKEIKTRKKTLLGYGDEHTVYPYEKDPNFVIKKQSRLSERNLDNYINIQREFPKYVAKVVKPEGKFKGYYLQEVLDNERFMDDITKVIVTVHNRLLEFLSKKYKTPKEAYVNFSGTIGAGNGELNFNGSKEGGFEAGDISLGAYGSGLYRSDNWDSALSVLKINTDSIYNSYESLLDPLEPNTAFSIIGKDIPLVQKLHPLFKVTKLFGEFHEGNVGYDKNDNLKILDL